MASGLHLAFYRAPPIDERGRSGDQLHFLHSSLIGGLIGFLSGIVGVGGGIFLAPFLYFSSWETPRQIAAACSLFILVNSLAGLSGQVVKIQNFNLTSLAAPYWPLPVAVFLGRYVGSWVAGSRLNPRIIRALTAILILYVAIRLLHRWVSII